MAGFSRLLSVPVLLLALARWLVSLLARLLVCSLARCKEKSTASFERLDNF